MAEKKVKKKGGEMNPRMRNGEKQAGNGGRKLYAIRMYLGQFNLARTIETKKIKEKGSKSSGFIHLSSHRGFVLLPGVQEKLQKSIDRHGRAEIQKIMAATATSSLSKLLNPSYFQSNTPKINNLVSLPPQSHKQNLRFALKSPPLTHLFSIYGKSSKPLQPNFNSTPIKSLFTGIVEEIGEVKHLGYDKVDSFTMRILGKIVLEDIHLGDSISVNGTCLTVTEFDTQASEFSLGVSPETLRKTSLGELEIGSPINLERAVKPSTRMGGHFVQGHVDGTGIILGRETEGDSLWVKVKAGKELLKYIVPKGFIAVDGTSLTVVDVFDEEESFNFMLVAYTQQNVVIPLKKIGQKVNLEVDILGKYVERLLSSGFVDSMRKS